jgi:phenylacetate-CoA ligase
MFEADSNESRFEELADWPVLSKEEIRRNPSGFLADDLNRENCLDIKTSGSTGTPLTLVANRGGVRHWYALFEARWRQWHEVNKHHRWATLGGQMVARPGRKRPPYWVWNRPMRQLYLSAYHITPSTVADYVGAMRDYCVEYLLGYPSAIFELAREARNHGIECPHLKVVISNAEPLLREQREMIGTAFSCLVRDTYGMAEMVAAAGECENGTLHIWPEAGVIEVLDDDGKPVPDGEVGRLVCTGLLNEAMPLIRYDVGDRGALAPPNEGCPCGRSLPIIRFIEGRLDDVVFTTDGRRIGRLDTVFKADLPIRLAQIIQEVNGRLIVKVVPDSSFNGSVGEEIRRRLRARVGKMEIDLQEVSDIPRSPAGKFRGVISKVASHGGCVE